MFREILSKTRYIYRQALFPYTPSGVKKKVIFIHIPKSAGTAVRVALGEPEAGRHHLPWWVYQQASPRRFEEYYKFAFVRHPLTRALSAYSYLKRGGNQLGDLSTSDYLNKYNNFEDFLEGELLKGAMIYHPIFRPQSWYLCNYKGEIQVDFVGKFESIDKDFQHVANQIGLKSFDRLPKINNSVSRKETISLAAQKEIFNLYKDDFLFFGY
ncbi:Sulfotransferase family protein [Alcanivorax sp. DSM 26295]|nr:Sulfotransferase family protein [Alcanivorax sp. DSM 26295]